MHFCAQSHEYYDRHKNLQGTINKLLVGVKIGTLVEYIKTTSLRGNLKRSKPVTEHFSQLQTLKDYTFQKEKKFFGSGSEVRKYCSRALQTAPALN